MENKFDIKTNPNLVIALGAYIRNKRTKRNIGLREMAEQLNISPAYLSNLELGKHPMTNPLLLKSIAKILSVDYLTLYKIVGYTDIDKKTLKEEIWDEIIEEISDKKLFEIIQTLKNLDKTKLNLVEQYIKLINKS